MSTQVKKTYRKLNPDMLYDEMRDILARHGLSTHEERMQTYSIGSGATQSRVTAPVMDNQNRQAGTMHILGSADANVRMALTLEEDFISEDVISAVHEDLEFILGSYEVKW